MTNLFTKAQVHDTAVRAGFTPDQSTIASAIALVESNAVVNGVPYADADMVGDQALADEKWGYSYGLMQIRSLRSQKGTGGVRDELRLPEPDFNLRSALVIFNTYGWTAWSTYTSGAYKAFLQDIFPPAPGTYVVVPGDTLSQIGDKLGIDWHELAELNGIVSPYLLNIGRVLKLPFRLYTVVAGDTLGALARRFGTTVAQLVSLNNISDPNKIQVGQVLRIPGP